jgi:hypothetical protein
MAESLPHRLRAELDGVRAAVLAAQLGETSPAHREVTGALVAELLERFLGRGGGDQALREIGAGFAAAGSSHSRVLHELSVTLIELSRRTWCSADSSEAASLLRLTHDAESAVAGARAVLSEGYCAAYAASGTRSTSRRQLAENLVAGRPVNRRTALACGVTMARQYAVLCVATNGRPTPDEVVDRIGLSDVLVRPDGGTLIVLVPVPRQALDHPERTVRAAFDRLVAVHPVSVAGGCTSTVDGIPDAVDDARVVLELAQACGRSGPVLAEDVMVERALVGRGSAVDDLAGLIASLDRWPHLPETLRALYEADLDRSRTADVLHIARRTLAKRLDRIEQLTGIRPTSARGVQTFMSALAVHRMSRTGQAAPTTTTATAG